MHRLYVCPFIGRPSLVDSGGNADTCRPPRSHVVRRTEVTRARPRPGPVQPGRRGCPTRPGKYSGKQGGGRGGWARVRASGTGAPVAAGQGSGQGQDVPGEVLTQVATGLGKAFGGVLDGCLRAVACPVGCARRCSRATIFCRRSARRALDRLLRESILGRLLKATGRRIDPSRHFGARHPSGWRHVVTPDITRRHWPVRQVPARHALR